MNSGSSTPGGSSFGQFFADAGPRYDTKQVLSRRAKIYRPDKRKRKKVKYL